MDQAWRKIFDLIKRTGDRCLVIDDETEEVFAVMDLKSYEKLIFNKSEVKDLTEEELLDRINRDLAVWQSSQNLSGKDVVLDEAESEEEEGYYIEPVE